MDIRYFKGFPFKLYKITNEKHAVPIAKTIKKQGYYVRTIKTSKGIEIWVSLNPKWFYRFGR